MPLLRVLLILAGLLVFVPAAVAQTAAADEEPFYDTPDAARWQHYCVQHFDTWAKETGFVEPPRDPAAVLSMGRGFFCRGAFDERLKTDAERIARLKSDLSAKVEADRLEAQEPLPKPTLVSAPDIPAFYPKSARKAGLEGKAVVRCELDSSGAAESCAIVTSSGVPALDDATVTVALQMRWTQTIVDGRAIPRTIDLPIRWVLPR